MARPLNPASDLGQLTSDLREWLRPVGVPSDSGSGISQQEIPVGVPAHGRVWGCVGVLAGERVLEPYVLRKSLEIRRKTWLHNVSHALALALPLTHSLHHISPGPTYCPPLVLMDQPDQRTADRQDGTGPTYGSGTRLLCRPTMAGNVEV